MSSQETADKILGAFLSLTAERGMSMLTPRDIAAAAGVFRHFGGRAPLARGGKYACSGPAGERELRLAAQEAGRVLAACGTGDLA